MNKTVNINLAGIFFHIDEDAYAKLQRYLDAIKRSFTDSQGRSEIVADIEARIAELFTERVKHDKQVIGNKEVDEVITIMGQPEDYLVDDEIFEDEPMHTSKTIHSKKLFRDTDNSYIGGVASGLGHYLGIEAIWVRLLWVLLAFATGGTFILIYILFWMLVPEAVTTSEKLTMTGEPVNITNIERKIKDGFDNVSQTVSDTVKKVDFNKQGNKIKSSSKTFFDAIGNLFMFILKVFSKFIGIILIIVGAATLLGLIVAFFTVGLTDYLHVPGFDFINAANAAETPVWLFSLCMLFAIGIPFFFILYLGLRILVNNIKSIGNIAKFSLLGLWLMAIIGIVIIGVRQASEHAEDANISQNEQFTIASQDTLSLRMIGNDRYQTSSSGRMYRESKYKIYHNENDEKIIYSSDISIKIRSTNDSVVSVRIIKYAEGRNYKQAKNRATNINYNYQLVGNELQFDSYLITDSKNKFSDQHIEVILTIPVGTVLNLNENTQSFLNSYTSNDNLITYSDANHLMKISEDEATCLDCEDDSYKINIDVNEDGSQIKLDENGLKIRNDSSSIEINKNGVKSNSETVRVSIDKNGIEITSDDQ